MKGSRTSVAMAAPCSMLCTPLWSEIGDAENISKSYVSRILRLALLHTDIIDAILAGRLDQWLMLERLERPLPASWEEQRIRILEPWML